MGSRGETLSNEPGPNSINTEELSLTLVQGLSLAPQSLQ